MPTPGYRRRAQGFSPSPCLDGSQRFPGLFHPGPARGVPPFRASSLCRAVTPLGVPCLPDVCRTLPAPDRSPNGAATKNRIHPATRTLPHGRPSAMCADRGGTRAASCANSAPTIPRGIDPADPGHLSPGPAVPVADRRPVRLQGFCSLQRARSPRPVVKPVPRPLPSWASPLQGSLARFRGSAFLSRHPLSGLCDHTRDVSAAGQPPAPQGVLGAAPGRPSCEVRRPS